MMHPHAAQQLALQLLQQHALSGWRFRFDHARRRFGSCRFAQRLITLSRPLVLLNEEAEVKDTLLHEIAHALTPGDGHGRKWKQKCIEIGARPQRCYADATVASPPRRPALYLFGCLRCDWWVERRRVIPPRHICARCGGGLHYREKSCGQLFTAHRTASGQVVKHPAGSYPA